MASKKKKRSKHIEISLHAVERFQSMFGYKYDRSRIKGILYSQIQPKYFLGTVVSTNRNDSESRLNAYFGLYGESKERTPFIILVSDTNCVITILRDTMYVIFEHGKHNFRKVECANTIFNQLEVVKGYEKTIQELQYKIDQLETERNQLYFNISDIKNKLDCHERTIRKWFTRGKYGAVKDRKWMFSFNTFKKLITEHGDI